MLMLATCFAIFNPGICELLFDFFSLQDIEEKPDSLKYKQFRHNFCHYIDSDTLQTCTDVKIKFWTHIIICKIVLFTMLFRNILIIEVLYF